MTFSYSGMLPDLSSHGNDEEDDDDADDDDGNDDNDDRCEIKAGDLMRTRRITMMMIGMH